MSNIFNNIKVLTDLEVKNTATMDQGLIVSGAISGTTGIRVKEDAIIDGQLIVGGQVVNQGYAQIGALVVEGVTSLSGNLIVTGSQYLTGDLNVTGISNLNGKVTGSLNIDIAGNVSASSNISASSFNGATGTFSALNAGTLSVNSLYLPGNFGVSGSAQLGQNNSSVITVAGQLSASAGIEVTTGGFNAANGTGYKLKGTEALKANANNITLESGSLSKVQLGNLGYGGTFVGKEGVKILSKDVTMVVGPRLYINLGEGQPVQLDITGSYSKLYSTGGDVLFSGSTGIYAESDLVAEKLFKLSGSSNFSNITSVTRDGNGLYDVDAAIHALDQKISSSDTNYAKMRFISSGSITPSTLTLDPVALGADSVFFGTAQKNYLVADVMIRINSSEAWTNDLTSIQIYESDGKILVDLDVPAAEAGWEYRMIIVNENGELFI